MLLNALFIGLLGTLIADALSLLTKKIFKIPFLDYAWVGRWFLYMKQGQFTHTNIIQSAPLSGEKSFVWFMHYAIGIVIAFIMIWLFQVGLIPLNPYLYALLLGSSLLVFRFLSCSLHLGLVLLPIKLQFQILLD